MAGVARGDVPGRKPDGRSDQQERIRANLSEPGWMTASRRTGQSAPVDAGARLGDVRCCALVVMGSLDPDRADPRAEAEAIVAAMPPGLAEVELIEGAGHYPHAQFLDETLALLLAFLTDHAHA